MRSDDHDQGGNAKFVKAAAIAKGKLHHYWDTEFVKRLGSDPTQVAAQLVAKITAAQVKAWSKGDPSSWAMQSHDVGKRRAYGGLGAPDATGTFSPSSIYVKDATDAVSLQPVERVYGSPVS